jgi:hypothetical protein
MTWRLLAASALCLGLTACAPANARPTPSAPGVQFEDDFSDPTSGWDTHTGADLTTDYVDGRYLIAVEEPLVDVWARPGLSFDDAIIEVDTQFGAGPVNNEYGVLCRYERHGDQSNSFYFFFVSSDGYYALGKVVRDARTILSPEQGSFQPTDSLRLEPDATNALRVTCSGDSFALAVNGVTVGEFTDDELSRGDIALIAGTFDEGGVRIFFDNVVVRDAES